MCLSPPLELRYESFSLRDSALHVHQVLANCIQVGVLYWSRLWRCYKNDELLLMKNKKMLHRRTKYHTCGYFNMYIKNNKVSCLQVHVVLVMSTMKSQLEPISSNMYDAGTNA